MSKVVERMEKPCKQCGKVMQLRLKVYEATIYCSRICKGKAHYIAHGLKPCSKPNTGSFKRGERLGQNHPRYVAPIRLTCHNCGAGFERKPWELRGNGKKGLFCSFTCKCAYDHTQRTGERSPLWRGGEKTYRGRGWKEARLIVVRDQGGKCATCDRYIGDSLPVHHIRPFREFSSPTEANQRENLIGLCQSCHMKQEPRIKGLSKLQAQVSQTS